MPKVRSVTVHRAAIPLRQTIRHASHERVANDTLLVRTELSDGSVGWGEGLPREYVTGETIDTAWSDADRLERFVGANVSTLSDAVRLVDGLSIDDAGPRDCRGNSVRCAWDISVLDAVTRSLGRPIAAALDAISLPADPAAMPLLRSPQRVRYSAVLPAASTARKAIWRAVRMRAFDMQNIKVKLGVDGHDDETTLRRYRRWLGERVGRVDANEAWTAAELPAKLSMLARNGVFVCEQPLPHASVADLDGTALRNGGDEPVSIMLDESFCTRTDLDAAVRHRRANLFNIRLSKCGGLIASLRLLRAIRNASSNALPLGAMLGCQVGETAILSAAGRAFASRTIGLLAVEGSYDRFLVGEPLGVEDITFRRGGWSDPLPGPGLGITIDDAAIERVSCERKTFGG